MNKETDGRLGFMHHAIDSLRHLPFLQHMTAINSIQFPVQLVGTDGSTSVAMSMIRGILESRVE
jgi:hypothetical protein